MITEALLKSKPKSPAKSRKKIAKEWEREKRLEAIQPFVEEFNRFREFYVGITNEWTPKTDAQITCIENVMQLCEEEDIDLGLLVGSSFKALEWKPATPSIQQIQSSGLDKYYQYNEEVLLDIDNQRLEE